MPAMPITEMLPYEGRQLRLAWLPSPFAPTRDQVTQVSGVCFTSSGKIVLVAGQQGKWALPGGHVEPGELLEQTLRREVLEEACASVRRAVYLGAQQVNDPDNPDGPRTYYQARFWARVELKRFRPQFERTQQTLVPPPAFLTTLNWGTTQIAQAMLDAALAEDKRFRSRSG
jgi:ADP-ribose pyrophosphatase YjhB (NUDIX family)